MGNSKIIRDGLERHAKRMADEYILPALFRVADETVIYIEGGGVVPVDTSNLKDSTGVGVYYDGSLQKYIPIQDAIVPREGVWGTDQISTALAMASTMFSTGIWLVLMSTMPYAVKVDLSHANWFSDTLVNDLKDRILNEFI